MYKTCFLVKVRRPLALLMKEKYSCVAPLIVGEIF